MHKLDNALSTSDIYKILEKMKINFNGVYNRDTLPSRLTRGFYILNLDSVKGPGTHWTSFYYNYPKHSIYFDPFGFVPPEETERKIKPYTYNDVDIQDIDSTACGWYCIGFIKFLHNKQNIYGAFEAFIDLFDGDTTRNDAILHRLIN